MCSGFAALDEQAWEQLAAAALEKGAVDACAAGLLSASDVFGTPIGSVQLQDRGAAARAHARAKADTHRWRRSLDDLRHLPAWSARGAYLREHLCPGRAFMDALHPGPGPLWWRYTKRALARLRAWL